MSSKVPQIILDGSLKQLLTWQKEAQDTYSRIVVKYVQDLKEGCPTVSDQTIEEATTEIRDWSQIVSKALMKLSVN